MTNCARFTQKSPCLILYYLHVLMTFYTLAMAYLIYQPLCSSRGILINLHILRYLYN